MPELSPENKKLKEEALKQMQQPSYRNNTQFSIKVGQACNQALDKQLAQENSFIFDWKKYKKDAKEFFKINQEIEEELR